MSEHDNDYGDKSTLPPLVALAASLAERFEFRNSCAAAYAPLLQVLAAQVRGGVIGEPQMRGVTEAFRNPVGPGVRFLGFRDGSVRAAHTSQAPGHETR